MNDFNTFSIGKFQIGRKRSWPAPALVEPKAAKRRCVCKMTNQTGYSAQIIRIAKHGDKLAFADLFGFYAPRIKGFFMRGGMGAGQAEELAQETMLMVWRKAALFDPEKASASTWIFTIARNLRVDAIRRERYPAQYLLEEHDREPQPSPSDGLLKTESEERIRLAIRSLSPEQISVIQLHYFDDKPHSEIARSLDLPLGTVKSRLRLAMQHLRSLMGEE